MAGLTLPKMRDPAPPTTLLWCQDTRTLAQLLTSTGLARTSLPDRATLAVVEADRNLLDGAWTQDHIAYPAPLQILLDAFFLQGQAAELARTEALSW